MTHEEVLLAKKTLPRLSRLIFEELGPAGTDALLQVLDDTEHYGNHRVARMLETLDLDISVWQIKVWRDTGLRYRPELIPELQQLKERVRGSGLRLVHPVHKEERRSA